MFAVGGTYSQERYGAGCTINLRAGPIHVTEATLSEYPTLRDLELHRLVAVPSMGDAGHPRAADERLDIQYRVEDYIEVVLPPVETRKAAAAAAAAAARAAMAAELAVTAPTAAAAAAAVGAEAAAAAAFQALAAQECQVPAFIIASADATFQYEAHAAVETEAGLPQSYCRKWTVGALVATGKFDLFIDRVMAIAQVGVGAVFSPAIYRVTLAPSHRACLTCFLHALHDAPSCEWAPANSGGGGGGGGDPASGGGGPLCRYQYDGRHCPDCPFDASISAHTPAMLLTLPPLKHVMKPVPHVTQRKVVDDAAALGSLMADTLPYDRSLERERLLRRGHAANPSPFVTFDAYSRLAATALPPDTAADEHSPAQPEASGRPGDATDATATPPLP